MTGEANRIPPIHQRKFEMGRRAGESPWPGITGMIGSGIGTPRWLSGLWSGALPNYVRNEIVYSATLAQYSRCAGASFRDHGALPGAHPGHCYEPAAYQPLLRAARLWA